MADGVNNRAWQRVDGEWVEVTALMYIPVEEVREVVKAVKMARLFGNSMLQNIDGKLVAKSLFDHVLLEKTEPKIYRASGDMECEKCGAPYSRHPTEERSWALAAEDPCPLHRLCNGDLVKT